MLILGLGTVTPKRTGTFPPDVLWGETMAEDEQAKAEQEAVEARDKAEPECLEAVEKERQQQLCEERQHHLPSNLKTA